MCHDYLQLKPNIWQDEGPLPTFLLRESGYIFWRVGRCQCLSIVFTEQWNRWEGKIRGRCDKGRAPNVCHWQWHWVGVMCAGRVGCRCQHTITLATLMIISVVIIIIVKAPQEVGIVPMSSGHNRNSWIFFRVSKRRSMNNVYGLWCRIRFIIKLIYFKLL